MWLKLPKSRDDGISSAFGAVVVRCCCCCCCCCDPHHQSLGHPYSGTVHQNVHPCSATVRSSLSRHSYCSPLCAYLPNCCYYPSFESCRRKLVYSLRLRQHCHLLFSSWSFCCPCYRYWLNRTTCLDSSAACTAWNMAQKSSVVAEVVEDSLDLSAEVVVLH
jgi:hypothetical protein